jgi:hypothetical protein
MGLLFACMFAALGSTLPGANRYVYIENTSRSVCIIRGAWNACGHLDARGKLTVTQWVLNGQVSFVGGVKIGERLNAHPLRGKPLYELRSGRLVPGTFDDEGMFVPEIGGKVINFAEYRYTPTAPKIWNLPGHFLTESEAERFLEAKGRLEETKRRLDAIPPGIDVPGLRPPPPPRSKDWQ